MVTIHAKQHLNCRAHIVIARIQDTSAIISYKYSIESMLKLLPIASI